MKIIATDNLARESVADRLVADNISDKREGELMVDALNSCRRGEDWYVLVADNYRLSRGMEDLL